MIKASVSARYFFTLGAIFLVVLGMYFLKSVLVPICISFIFSVILLRPAKFLERKGFSRTWAAVAVVVLGSVLLLGGIVAATWQVSNLTDNVADIVAKADVCVQKQIVAIEKQFPQLKKQKLINYRQRSEDLFKRVGEYVGGSVTNVVSLVADALLMPLYVFFLLSYRDFFRQFFHQAIKEDNHHIDTVLRKIHRVVQGYLSGLFSVMCIVAGMNFVGLFMFGVPYSWFFAVLASLLMVIPYVGVFIGSLLPVLLVLVTKDSAWAALGVGLWMWAVQVIEGNLITPNLVGSKVSVNPFVALLALILFGQLWGIAGLMLAIPLVAILKVIFDSVAVTKPYGMLLGEVAHRPSQPENEEENIGREMAAA